MAQPRPFRRNHLHPRAGSADSLDTWATSNTGLPNWFIFALAIDTEAPAELFAGTYGSGVLKSVDSGASWAGVNAGLADLSVLSLALAPTDSRTLYAGLDGASVWQATTALWVFADGFESGQVCAWSAAVGGGCP